MPKPLAANPLHWSVSEVSRWAQDKGVQTDVIAHIRKLRIDGPTLIYLNAEALQEVGAKYDKVSFPDGWLPIQSNLLALIDNIPHEQNEYTANNDAMAGLSKVGNDDERMLVFSGYCTKLGSARKTWKRRHFRLFSDGVLTYSKSDSESASILGEMLLSDVRSIRTGLETDWKKLGAECPMEAVPEVRLEIVSNSRTLRMYTASAEEATKWGEHLDTCRQRAMRKATLGRMMLHNKRSRFMEHDILKRRMVPLKKGWLYKSGAQSKKWKRRFMVLTQSRSLHYWKDERCLGAPIGTIKMKYCKRIRTGGDCKWEQDIPSAAMSDRRFQIATDTRTYMMFSSDREDAEDWIAKLIEAHEEEHRHPDDRVTAQVEIEAELQPIAENVTLDIIDVDEDDDDDDASVESSGFDDDDDNDDTDDAYFVDRYLDMYNLPHTPLRRSMLLEALKIGRSSRHHQKRLIHIIYNPVSGSGLAKKNVDYTLVPVLEVAGIDFKVIATTHRGHAREYSRTLNYTKADGLIVAGGDGMVSEVMSGLMDRTDDCVQSGFPVGIIPSGTANAMAHELDLYESKNYIELISAMSLMVARGVTRKIDLIRMQNVKGERSVCGLSCVGWGLAGAVAMKADQLRWLPGQRNFRYDIAGFVTLMKDWPLSCEAEFEYLAQVSKDEFEWKKETTNILNMIASSCSKLGVDHPICKEAKIDDGMLSMVFMGGKHSRTEAALAGRSMKTGNYLAEHKYMTMYRIKEFKMKPVSKSDVPMLIDGDPWGLDEVHVKVLHQAVTVFCKPIPK